LATRMLSPDGACDGVTVPFGRPRKYAGTTIEVTDLGHVKALKQAGYTVGDTAGPPAKASGYVCPVDGFKSFFKICKCGAECVRPDPTA
jgi:hypothetical protein